MYFKTKILLVFCFGSVSVTNYFSSFFMSITLVLPLSFLKPYTCIINTQFSALILGDAWQIFIDLKDPLRTLIQHQEWRNGRSMGPGVKPETWDITSAQPLKPYIISQRFSFIIYKIKEQNNP